MIEKSELRRHIKTLRQQLTPSARDAMSRKISDFVLASSWYQKSESIMLYVPINNETDTSYIIRHAFQNAKSVALPITDPQTNLLSIAYIKSLDDLKRGMYNIQEPDQAKTYPGSPTDIDLIIVPAIAFDQSGNRVGYGKGCYDKFLPLTRKDCIKIGINYSFAVFDEIESNYYDVKMDYVITESGIISISKQEI